MIIFINDVPVRILKGDEQPDQGKVSSVVDAAEGPELERRRITPSPTTTGRGARRACRGHDERGRGDQQQRALAEFHDGVPSVRTVS